MTNTYAALDTVGFVTEPAVIAERVLSDYISTNYSQSIIFFGQLRSLQRAVQVNAGNMDGTAKAIEADLQALLSAYLDNVSVTCNAKAILNSVGQQTDKFEVFIEAAFSTGKGMDTLASTIRQTNEGFTRIASIVSN